MSSVLESLTIDGMKFDLIFKESEKNTEEDNQYLARIDENLVDCRTDLYPALFRNVDFKEGEREPKYIFVSDHIAFNTIEFYYVNDMEDLDRVVDFFRKEHCRQTGERD